MSFNWLTKESEGFLKKGYLSEGEEPKERIRVICDKAQSILGIEGYSDKLYDYMGRGWISLSSPIWANFGKKRGLPISCYGSHVDDDIGSILYSQSEVGMMSKMGGGTAGYFGDIRERGSKISDFGVTSGAVHFMELFEKVSEVVSQGGVRRGRFSPYLPIEHGDIEDFLDIGSEGNSIQGLTTAVTVTDEWLESMIAGDPGKRKTWAKVLKRRTEVGYPYIFFYDNVQRNTVDVYKDLKLPIRHSQLCSEILLPTDSEESFVCDLASINMLHYDEIKDTDLVETIVFLLDAVMTEFLTKLESFRDSESKADNLTFEYMQRAYKFAKKHRALGVGQLGWHSYLQSKMIPFASPEAMEIAHESSKLLQEKSYKASKELAVMFGEPEILKGYGRRNTTLNALAPTTSSAFILGQVSQSIEPLMSNYYIKDLAKAKAEIKNKFLEAVLCYYGMNTKEVWLDIAKHDGSVQHLDFLTDHEREVFLTFSEINPYAVIEQAAIRQEFLDQTQSLNLMLPTSTTPKELNKLVIHAWEIGICTLYYHHSTNAAQQFLQKSCVTCEA
jgi:ribonucleoside-diphosphate reductase alpha chain